MRFERYRRATSCITGILLVGLSAPAVQAQARTERIDSIVRAAFNAGNFHGALLVAERDEVIYRGAFGMADRSTGAPNQPETLTPIYSITKPFTAIIVLQLVQEGRMDLDATLGHYLPDFRSSAVGRVTVHHLLSHTSGLPDYMLAIPGYMTYEPPNLTRDSVLALVRKLPLEFEPGRGFAYSNTGYVLLACIIEGVTGQSYDKLLDERIFQPLGMANSRWMETEAGSTMAHQYMPRFEREAPPVRIFPGEAGIVSTLDDMHRFGQAIGSPELLSSEMWALAFTPHARPEDATRPHPGTRFPHGYGFSLAEDTIAPGKTARRVSHGGVGYGGSAMFQHYPEYDWTIVFWNNVGGLRPQIPGLLEAVASAR